MSSPSILYEYLLQSSVVRSPEIITIYDIEEAFEFLFSCSNVKLFNIYAAKYLL
jgi:hypothetical protein